ncbi:TetR/AcrR family transcriptional regulator [Glaciimonas sp. GNP009]
MIHFIVINATFPMVYRRSEQVETHLAQNRARILAAARRLVSEGGWQEGQVASVAAAAGLATGTVYRYFSSKAELFAEVLAIVSQREVAVIAEIINGDGSPTERLQCAVRTFVKRAMRNRRLAFALIAEPCDREIDEARLVWRFAIGQEIVGIIEEGQRSGEFRSGLRANVAAAIIVGGFMEALVGPLSPLSPHLDTESPVAAGLADEIAVICCASVCTAHPTTHI